ncbi:MAG: Type secretion system domain protein, partial [Solirubrobacterales bacterium]|nr:Type secretion system domain protein [Solirubrobacterales bacterium]
MSGAPTVLLGALAGGLVALAVREAVLASPAAAAWLRQALEPLRRAGREGYAPSTRERRRLAALGAAAAIATGWLVGGLEVALPLSVAGPGIAAWAISSRRRRYRLAVERSLPEVATAVADSLAAGRSLRASLPAAATYLDGPPAA